MRNTGFLLLVVLSGFAVSAGKANAQVLNWSEKFPKEGTVAKSVRVEGTVDITKAPKVTGVKIWVLVNGHKKGPALPVEIDLTGKWGPTNAFQAEGEAGADVEIIVETVGAPTTYLLVGKHKTKK